MSFKILKIALAGMLHDIGKFMERAELKIPQKYIDNNQALYQPKTHWHYTHKHALYTAYFIDEMSEYFPSQFTEYSSPKDSIVNLCAKHHRPDSDSPEQIIIQEADCISSGIERREFEEKEESVRKAKEIPLLSIFEDISITENWKAVSSQEFRFSYPVREISPVNIFPIEKQNVTGQAYSELYQKFVKVFKNLPHKDSPRLWMEHLDSALFVFTTLIPSATLKEAQGRFEEIISDISLYDHGRLTSALAIAMYLYHLSTDSMDENSIKARDIKKFLLIEGNFYGIQDFIFSEGGSTAKHAAKLLRGRSFYVSLLSELAADFILDKLNLPFTSIVTNAAGKFKILAPNTEKHINAVKEAEDEINHWLVKNFYGEVSIGLSWIEASPDDFICSGDSLGRVLRAIGNASEERKLKKLDLTLYGGTKSTARYLDTFSDAGVCSLCNRRAAKLENQINEDYLCDICHDHVKIGENLVKKDTLVVATADAELHETLKMPVFDKYQVSFLPGRLSELVRQNKIIHYWNINSLWKNENILDDFVSIKLINGYVPRFTPEYKNEIEKITYGESDKEETIEAIQNQAILNFHHIARLALQKTEQGMNGVDALGVFKADIDNLGTIFTKGLRPEKRTFSRYAALSRQLNLFFTLYLPYLCKTEFKNIYTIFAGGDDLFLIAPWSEITRFSMRLSEDFYRYCCNNSEITLSAGVYITQPETPVLKMAEASEKALEKAKNSGKNKITIFNCPVEWSSIEELEKIRQELESWFDDELITISFLYKLNELRQLAEEEKEILKRQLIHEKLNPLIWRAKLHYFATRNIAKGKNREERIKTVEEVLSKLVIWIEKYRESFRIPLWQTIYMRRKA
ncbi:type III-A CRISPR-associated protein Cas10/Csm1 [Thermodesulfovibrio sp. 3907-1M]|uniref:CRISPR system single-strand-specific deoxyribonuclease Cas10/Csm1 (subtype III-A) n=1 Tax=Thermodesulfovibrio autotrophicus TaxID=3118333 RepID=A0AAU8GYG2_9BACT